MPSSFDAARIAMRSPLIRSQVIAAALVTAALLVIYIPTFAHAFDVWTTDEEFSFAFLVPPISLGLCWWKRKEFVAALGRGYAPAVAVMAAGLLMLVVSARTGVHVIAGVSFVVTALGALAYLYGVAAARVAVFPVGFMLFGLCLFRGLLSSVGFFLQGLTARTSALAASLVGVPIHRSGVDLFAGTGANQFHFVVAESCSGLSSLLASLCLGTLLVGIARTSLWRHILLIVLIVPIVYAANVLRVTLVLTLSQWFGYSVAYGFFHGSLSATVFIGAIILHYIVGRALGAYRWSFTTPSSGHIGATV